ncbi:MAG: hypothetical protein RMK61_09730 [Bacteroidota bacterium]|nr:hypothetical protein [Bacteroidota bacterium]
MEGRSLWAGLARFPIRNGRSFPLEPRPTVALVFSPDRPSCLLAGLPSLAALHEQLALWISPAVQMHQANPSMKALSGMPRTLDEAPFPPPLDSAGPMAPWVEVSGVPLGLVWDEGGRMRHRIIGPGPAAMARSCYAIEELSGQLVRFHGIG